MVAYLGISAPDRVGCEALNRARRTRQWSRATTAVSTWEKFGMNVGEERVCLAMSARACLSGAVGSEPAL